MYVSNFEAWLKFVQTREPGAAKIDPTIHAHCFWRPAGAWSFGRTVVFVSTNMDVWMAGVLKLPRK